jgi:zinc transporter ZupT
VPTLGEEPEHSDPTVLLWSKIGFIIISFIEGLTGIIPTYSRNCRESPTFLGVANAFAGGIFLAIAFTHILPEEQANWL